MSILQKTNFNTDINVIKNILETDGCVVIENVLNQDELNKLKKELDIQFNQVPNCSGDFYGYETKRISALVKKSEVCREISINEKILSVMDRILLKNCHQYQLNLTQGIRIGSGEPQQVIHRDDLMFPFPHTGSEWMINAMWAVDDFTNENGATTLVPGSHIWEPTRLPEEHEIIQAEMKAGSVLIYYASLLHSGGANKTDKPRTGVVMSYALGWLRQAENHYLSIPLNEIKTYPERLQKLLGFFVHQPNLGCVEGQDPIELIKSSNVVNGRFQEFLTEEDQKLLREYRQSVSQ
jgi:ectoine hydroxylase-related dioxygenase (phytanoyl-CoA dioxygenase family)